MLLFYKQETITVAPCAANVKAIAFPIPVDDAVKTATFPFIGPQFIIYDTHINDDIFRDSL